LRRGRRRRSRQQPQCRRCRQSIDVADEDSQRLALARLEEPDLDPGQAAVSEQCVRQDPRDAQAESEISERESFVFFRFRRTVFRHRRRPHRSLSPPPKKKKNLQGPGYCDHCSADRAANLITCVPYCLLAARNVARAQTRERKIYAGSLCAVATFSTAYHALEASHKEAWARKADYWAIACAATAMGRMLFPKGDCPGFYDRDGAGEEGDAGGPCPALASPPPALFPPRRGRTRVSLSLTPFQPFAVITAHSVAMEAEFARRARKERRKEEASGGAFSSSSRHHHHHHHHHHHSHRDHGEKNSRPSLSTAHRLHVYSGAAAVAAFFAEVRYYFLRLRIFPTPSLLLFLFCFLFEKAKERETATGKAATGGEDAFFAHPVLLPQN